MEIVPPLFFYRRYCVICFNLLKIYLTQSSFFTWFTLQDYLSYLFHYEWVLLLSFEELNFIQVAEFMCAEMIFTFFYYFYNLLWLYCKTFKLIRPLALLFYRKFGKQMNILISNAGSIQKNLDCRKLYGTNSWFL